MRDQRPADARHAGHRGAGASRARSTRSRGACCSRRTRTSMRPSTRSTRRTSITTCRSRGIPRRSGSFPVVDDLLDDWQAEYLPEAKGLRLVGHQWSPRSHAIKDFLASNLIPYRWLDVMRECRDAGAARGGRGRASTSCRRCSSRTDRCCATPSRAQVAERLGRPLAGGPRRVRPRDRRRRARRTRGGGVRRLGGPADAPARPALRPAARRAPARASRTTSASRPA